MSDHPRQPPDKPEEPLTEEQPPDPELFNFHSTAEVPEQERVAERAFREPELLAWCCGVFLILDGKVE